MFRTRQVHILIALLLSIIAPVNASAFDLQWPLTCELGKDCWIQQYADHDTGPGASDFMCGSATYDGHDGTDIRVRDTSMTAPVVAAADGVVKGMRDGVHDKLVVTDSDKQAVANRECGNGVLVGHRNGWETQYCHMKSGSVVVRKGEKVAAGQKLGDVGYSGAAAFPHMHLSVRYNGKKVDPFSGDLNEFLRCG